MSRSAHGVSSAVFCSGVIPVLMAQTEIGLGETIPRLPCPENGFGTRRRSMLSMTTNRAPAELVPSFPPPPTRVGFNLGGSLVALLRYPIPLAGSWVMEVLASSFLEAVVVAQVAVLVI